MNKEYLAYEMLELKNQYRTAVNKEKKKILKRKREGEDGSSGEDDEGSDDGEERKSGGGKRRSSGGRGSAGKRGGRKGGGGAAGGTGKKRAIEQPTTAFMSGHHLPNSSLSMLRGPTLSLSPVKRSPVLEEKSYDAPAVASDAEEASESERSVTISAPKQQPQPHSYTGLASSRKCQVQSTVYEQAIAAIFGDFVRKGVSAHGGCERSGNCYVIVTICHIFATSFCFFPSR